MSCAHLPIFLTFLFPPQHRVYIKKKEIINALCERKQRRRVMKEAQVRIVKKAENENAEAVTRGVL